MDPAVGEIEMLPHAWPGGDEFQQAEAINDDGTIVGTEADPGRGAIMGAVSWQGPDHRPVGLDAPGDGYGFAYDINDRGDIVGSVSDNQSGPRASVWLAPDHQRLDITPPGAPYGVAYGVNDRRQVVGLVGEPDREWACRWDRRSGQVVELGGLGGLHSRALAVNEQGIAVGWAYTGEVTSVGYPISHATVFVARPGRH